MYVVWFVFMMGCVSRHQILEHASPETLALPSPPDGAPRMQLPGTSLVIRDARLIDGRGGPPQDNVDVWVQDGIIHQVGPDLMVTDLPEIDAQEMVLLPGLFAAHAHLQSVPGSILRQDDAHAIEVQQQLQLRAHLASGFTSVLDPAISVKTATQLRAFIDAGNPGPEIFVLAPFLTPAGGYMTAEEMRGEAFADFWPGLSKDTDIDAMYAQAAALDPMGTKVAIEDGVLFPNFPTFDDEDLDRIRDASRRAQSPLYVHSISNDEHRRALELEPHALVHMGLWDETIAPDVLDALVERRTYVITTVTLNHLASWGWRPTFQDDAWVQQRVPIIQWNTATHADTPRVLGAHIAEVMRPRWVPAGLARASSPMFVPSEADVDAATASGIAAVHVLEDAGVPWVVGADEGNSPAYTTFFHGVATQIELEQLDAGGLPRASILDACTRRPAEMLGVSDRLGTIEVGKQADLILVQQDPLAHGFTALKTMQWVIVRGEARTPASWLADP